MIFGVHFFVIISKINCENCFYNIFFQTSSVPMTSETSKIMQYNANMMHFAQFDSLLLE